METYRTVDSLALQQLGEVEFDETGRTEVSIGQATYRRWEAATDGFEKELELPILSGNTPVGTACLFMVDAEQRLPRSTDEDWLDFPPLRVILSLRRYRWEQGPWIDGHKLVDKRVPIIEGAGGRREKVFWEPAR